MRPWFRPASRLRGPRSCHDVPMTTTASPSAPRSSRALPMVPPAPNKFEPTRKNYTLRQEQTPENPVLIHKVFNKGGKKIAYLMYNAFVADFDKALNNAFADFKAQDIEMHAFSLFMKGQHNFR